MTGRHILSFCAAVALLSFSTPNLAKEASSTQSLKDSVLKAIENNPEVQEKWHSFLAAGLGYEEARGGYKPKIDMGVGYGFYNKDYSANRNYNGAYGEITLEQMLYDGSFTRSQTERLNNLQLVSYFNLLESSEKVAFDALAAYLDVQRERDLVALARENLAKHHQVYKQVEKKAKAGVARSADFEQVNGRLALAQSNLITEMSNLHDVSARYLRIIGAIPAASLEKFEYEQSPLPSSVKASLLSAYQTSPTYHAALRNIYAAEQSSQAAKSDYRPKVNLNARYGSQTYDGLGYVEGQSEASIGIELRYNLYNGNRNSASIRKSLQELNVAKDQRDLACINIRQNVQVAYNDTQKLAEQLPILNRHRLASAKVATAYKQQFDIGQRTLLDVLDIENEFFQASRAYTNARYDLTIANAKTLSTMGQLVDKLDLKRSHLPALSDLGAEPIKVDEAQACPAFDINEQERKLQDADLDGVANVYDQCPDSPQGDKIDAFGCSILEKEIVKVFHISFPKESIVIDKKYYGPIEDLARALRRYPNSKVEIMGHSSLGGSEAFNLRLSKTRADALAGILIHQFKVDTKRVSTFGMGTKHLIKNESSPQADQINQRIEVKVTAYNG